MRPYLGGLRHALPVLAVVALGNPASALPRGEITLAVPGTRPAPFPVRGTDTVELRYPTFRLDGTAEVSIVNTSEARTVVAWKLDYDRNGVRSSALIGDGYRSLADGYLFGSETAGGLIEPGGHERLVVPFPLHDDLADGRDVGLALDLVVFDDLSYEGDPNEARLIFEQRARDLATRGRWLPRVREIVRDTPGVDAAAPTLAALADEVSAEGAFASQRLARELEDAVTVLAHAPPSVALRLLDEHLELAELRLHVARQSTPPSYRNLQDRPVAGPKRQSAASGHWSCGTVSVGKTTTVLPCDSTSNLYRMTEKWTFGCDDPVHNGTETTNPRGMCLWWETCKPEFYGAETGQTTNGTVRWARPWQDVKAVAGPGWVRCLADGEIKRVAHDCPCEWVEEASPTESGPDGDDPELAPGDGTTNGGTPILIDLDRAGFRLTDLDGGVLFDIDADSVLERVSWTAGGSGDAFLALDRDGNGAIDGGHELFGDSTAQPPSAAPHGYLALAVFDEPAEGGDGDGWITAADAVFDALRLWVDLDHDGVSDAGEMTGLAAGGVEAIDLDFRENRRRDRHGNELRYRSLVRKVRGTTQSVDVFFLVEEP